MKGIPPKCIREHKFKSDSSSKAFYFDRVFHFQDQKFLSIPLKNDTKPRGNEVIEIMASATRLANGELSWEDGRVKLEFKGYVLHLFGCFIPLPLTALLGAEKKLLMRQTVFEMSVAITHPLWGNIYGYHEQIRENAEML